MIISLEFLQVLFVSCYLYLARRQDIAQEMERNLETADFIACLALLGCCLVCLLFLCDILSTGLVLYLYSGGLPF